MLTLALAKGHGPYGWGICSKYLIKELSERTEVNWLRPDYAEEARIPGKVLHAISSILFTPVHHVSGDYNAGYCFFELDPIDVSIKNAASFDHIFCGSTYNRQVLFASDIFHTSVLIQGVDHEVFKAVPLRKPDGKFVIFSGGKFEYRKGQDLVLAAFKRLMDKYPDMHLVTAWQNMWPESAATMEHSNHISLDLWGNTWTERMASLCAANSVPPERVTHYPAIGQSELSTIMENTDLGVFPNRCEGGTNLMLMEYMAKGRPAIASYNSGHIDILGLPSRNGRVAITLRRQDKIVLAPHPGHPLTAHWWNPHLDEVIERIEWAYLNRDELVGYGARAAEHMKQFTWKGMAETILKQMNDPKLDAQDYLPQRYMFGNLLTKMGYVGEGAEIGVYRGAFSRFIYSRWRGKMLHLIDRWKHVEGLKDITNHDQETEDKLYEKVKTVFAGEPDVNIIRAESVEASKQFQDGQLDWVYIDADHRYESCKADMETWFPKVRLGGLVAGHDYFDGDNEYCTFGVKTMVDEFVAKHGFKLMLSSDELNPMRTWYFVKDK